MIFDYEAIFSNAQAITSSAASTNVIQLGTGATMPAHFGTALHDFATGNAPLVHVQVVTTFTTSDAATLTVKLQTHEDADFGSTVHDLVLSPLTGTIAAATLVAGYHCAFPIRLPEGWGDHGFIRLYYTVGTGTFTAGKITAGLVLDRQTAGLTLAQMQ